jgi:hypothetical protein
MFNTHIRAHEEIIDNEHWYGDEAPSLGQSFTARKTAERQQEVVQILGRAARRAAKTRFKKLAQDYDALADKLDECGPRRRCGSLACPKCGRAFQKAKFAAQRRLIEKLAQSRPGKKLVMANVIPLSQEAEAPLRGNLSRSAFRISHQEVAGGRLSPIPHAARGAGCAAAFPIHSLSSKRRHRLVGLDQRMIGT